MSEVTLVDDYELVNCVATGNSTQVWEVKQRSSGQTFAMKLMLPEGFRDPDQKKALKHEATVAKSLEHPNIIQVFELVMTKEHAYFIMEYFRSTNLKQLYRSDLATAQSLIPRLIESLSQALAHMHDRGWIHKDIKPDNILLTKGGEFRLIDFSLSAHPAGGLGKLLGGGKGTPIQGTRTYIAPELIQRKPLSVSADIYSLGVTLYEVLVGRPPFVSSNPNELLMMHVRDAPEPPMTYNLNITPEASAFALRMLAKDPKKRPQSMQEVFSEVRTLRFFKEDAIEHAKAAADKENQNFLDSVSARLDSRTDATRDRAEALPAKPAAEKKSRLAIAQEAKAARLQGEKSAAGEATSSSTPAAVTPPLPTTPAMPTLPLMPNYPPQMVPPQGALPPGFPPGYGMPQGMPWGYPPGQMPQFPGGPAGYPPGMVPPGYGTPQQGYPPGQPFDPNASQPQFPGGWPPGQPLQPPAVPGQPVPGQPASGQQPPLQPATPPQPQQQTPQPPPKPAAPPVQPARPIKKDDPDDIPLMTDLPDVF